MGRRWLLTYAELDRSGAAYIVDAKLGKRWTQRIRVQRPGGAPRAGRVISRTVIRPRRKRGTVLSLHPCGHRVVEYRENFGTRKDAVIVRDTPLGQPRTLLRRDVPRDEEEAEVVCDATTLGLVEDLGGFSTQVETFALGP